MSQSSCSAVRFQYPRQRGLWVAALRRAWASLPRPAAVLLGIVCSATVMLPLGCGAGTGGPTTSFDVYFHNDALAADASDCTAVFPVHRVVPQTQAVASEALRSLFGGPNTEERGAGYRSFFSSDTAGLLKRLRIGHGTAYVDLEDPRDLLAGATSSCGAAEFQSEISTTLRQFPSVERVIFAIEGDPRAFYAWMGEPCGPANDDCDPQPFR